MVSPKMRFIGVVLAIVGLLVLSAACGTGSKSTESSAQSVKTQPGAASSVDSSHVATSGGAAVPAIATSGAATQSSTTMNWDRMIVRNADISLQVASVESMLAKVRSLTDGAGGVVFASSTSFNGNDQVATMTLDIPADQFDQVVNALRAAPGVKKVDHESITSQDVTSDYIDLQAQLRNLQATQSRLLALMDKATQLQDILTLEQELSKVEGQIEQTTGRINYLDKRTSFSRITLTLSPFVIVASDNARSGFDLARSVRAAWVASLRFTGSILTGVVQAGVFLWWFWPLVAIGLGIGLARRQRRRHTNGSMGIVA